MRMSYSYVKKKLNEPQTIQIGKNNVAAKQAILNKTQDLENQVSLNSSYTILILLCVLIVVFVSVVYIRGKNNRAR